MQSTVECNCLQYFLGLRVILLRTKSYFSSDIELLWKICPWTHLTAKDLTSALVLNLTVVTDWHSLLGWICFLSSFWMHIQWIIMLLQKSPWMISQLLLLEVSSPCFCLVHKCQCFIVKFKTCNNVCSICYFSWLNVHNLYSLLSSRFIILVFHPLILYAA